MADTNPVASNNSASPANHGSSMIRLEREVLQQEALLTRSPDDQALRQRCFELRLRLHDYDAAERLLTGAGQADFWPRAWRTLGIAAGKANDYPRAARCLRRAFASDPSDLVSGTLLASSLRLMGQAEAALMALEKVLRASGEYAPARALKAEMLAERGAKAEALALFQSVLDTEALGEPGFFKWVELMLEAQRGDELEAWLKERIRQQGDRHQLWAAFGTACLQRSAVDEAEAAQRKALSLAPENTRYLSDLAGTLRVAGRIEESNALYTKTLEMQPDNAQALRILGIEHKYTHGDPAFSRLHCAMAGVVGRSPKHRANLMYAMAKALEDVGDLPAAFAYYAQAGVEKKKHTPYDERASVSVMRALMGIYQNPPVQPSSIQGHPSRKPVFVVGMPRSGTSLLEQVLASHPMIDGVGEQKLVGRLLHGLVVNGRYRLDLGETGIWPLEEAVSARTRGERYVAEVEKRARPDARRIVDKMPGNFQYIGPILEMLPNAYLIHSRRHPVETCLSNYRLLFAEGQLWSYDLRELGRFYRRYHAMMARWHQLFGDRILVVRYENMIFGLEAAARHLIDYLDLPWDDACLRFFEADRPMRTASAAQVRKPIYASSTNRWRRYEPYLKPLLEELGPLVKEYEDELAAEGLLEEAHVEAS